MPRYTFTGHFETILQGLAHGVNAVLHRPGDDDTETDHGQPDGSTVVARPGDEIVTETAYPHPDMVNTETGEPDVAATDPTPDAELAAAFQTFNDAGQKAADSVQLLKDAAAGSKLPDVQPTAPIGSENPAPPGNPPATETGEQMQGAEVPPGETGTVSNEPDGDADGSTTTEGQE